MLRQLNTQFIGMQLEQLRGRRRMQVSTGKSEYL